MIDKLTQTSGSDSWENATDEERESGSFDLSLHARDHQLQLSGPKHVLGANDCFINSILSTGIKQFRVCGHLVSRSAQNSQHVLRFFHNPLHDAIMGELGSGRSDWHHYQP